MGAEGATWAMGGGRAVSKDARGGTKPWGLMGGCCWGEVGWAVEGGSVGSREAAESGSL